MDTHWINCKRDIYFCSISKSLPRSLRSAHTGQNFTFGEYNFERVCSYSHLEKLVTETYDTKPAGRERIRKGNRCFYGLHNIFRSRYYTANTKIKNYKIGLRPVETFGMEICTQTAKNEQELEVFERKVLRGNYGPVNDNGQWRKLHNHVIKQIYQSPPNFHGYPFKCSEI